MNAKQRKQAGKIAAYAASLADNRLLAAKAAETSAAIERQRLEADLYNARVVFYSEKDQHEAMVEMDMLALEAKKTYLDAMTKPSIEVIKDILVCLELDESPLEIAARLREIHGILEPKW